MTVNPGRDKIWLATAFHREQRPIKQAFVREADARAWVEERRRLSTTFVQWSVEAVWLIAANDN